MNDFFQNMLKQTNTNISNINDTIQDINRNLETIPNNSAEEAKKENAAVETVDLSKETNPETPIINTEAAKEMLTGEGIKEADTAFNQVLTGNPSQITEGVKSLLNWFNNLSLPFPIITNGATVSTKNTFTSSEIDAIANAVGNAVSSFGEGSNSFLTNLYSNLGGNTVGAAWQNALSATASGLKGALSGGQIASINAYDGATAAGSDQEIARNKAAVAGGQAATEAFDSTGIGNAFGNAIGTTADGIGSAITGAASGFVNSANLQATKDSLVAGLDAITNGSGTALAKNANLRENSFNNLLDAWGFNPNGSWNGNVNPLTMIPQSIIAARDIAQTFGYIPQIAYDGAINSILKVSNQAIANKNAQYGETGDVKVYTSLGDSVESGLGFKDYYEKFVNGESHGSPVVANTVVEESAPALVADALGAECNQYHMPGATTSELLYTLNPTKYEWALSPVNTLGLDIPQIWGWESILSAGQYSPSELQKISPKVIEDLKNSDVITLDIGWNDWWSMIIEGQGIRSSIQYALILNEIYQINPNAEVVLVGGYNPFEGWDWVPFMDDNIASYGMQAVFDVVMNSNKLMACMLYPGKCTYADTRHSEIITGTPALGVSLDDLMYNPHPTEEGAKHQANNILAALGKEKAYTEKEKGDFYLGEQNFTEADIGYFGVLEPTPDEYKFIQHGAEKLGNSLRPYTETNLNPSNGEINSRSSFLTNMAAAYGNNTGSTAQNIATGAVDTVHSLAMNVLPGMLSGGLQGEISNVLSWIIPGL